MQKHQQDMVKLLDGAIVLYKRGDLQDKAAWHCRIELGGGNRALSDRVPLYDGHMRPKEVQLCKWGHISWTADKLAKIRCRKKPKQVNA